MLARQNRITRGVEYRQTLRVCTSKRGLYIVTYVARNPVEQEHPRFGFIITKAVGNAPTRNRLRRRLKAICAEALKLGVTRKDIVFRVQALAGKTGFQALRKETLEHLLSLGVLQGVSVSQDVATDNAPNGLKHSNAREHAVHSVEKE